MPLDNKKKNKTKHTPILIGMCLVLICKTGAAQLKTDTIPKLATFIESVNKTDSIRKSKRYRLILGATFNATRDIPTILISSIIGGEYVLKNERWSLAYRNFFNAQFVSYHNYGLYGRTFAANNLATMIVNNCFETHYVMPTKSRTSFLKLGAGVYFQRNEGSGDHLFYIKSPHNQGITYSIYTKAKWLNVGFRHNIQLFYDYNFFSFGLKEIDRFNLCIEFPINIK